MTDPNHLVINKDGKALARHFDLFRRRPSDRRVLTTDPWDRLSNKFGLLLKQLGYRNGRIVLRESEWKVLALQHHEFVQLFLKVFGTFERWTIPVLEQILGDLVRMGVFLDSNHVAAEFEYCKKTVPLLNKAFGLCITDRTDPKVSRIEGAFPVTILLFKTCLCMNQLELCKSNLRALDKMGLSVAEAPLSVAVQFRKFLGIVRFQDTEYIQCEPELLFSLCHSPSCGTQIVHYLIPVWLSKGKLPSQSILQRHNVEEEYGLLLESVCQGHVSLFCQTLSDNETRWAARGTLHLMEQLCVVVYYRFFKRIWIITGRISRFPIMLFKTVMAEMGQSLDYNQVEAAIANLIEKVRQ